MLYFIVLDQSRVRTYLDSVAKGFAKNPTEMILALSVIGILLAVAITVLTLWRRKETRRLLEEGEKAFETIADRSKLTLFERDLLRTLASVSPHNMRQASLRKLLG